MSRHLFDVDEEVRGKWASSHLPRPSMPTIDSVVTSSQLYHGIDRFPLPGDA